MMKDMITPDTRLFCVIGDPVAHSLSPFIMNRAFSECGIDARYVALRVQERNLSGMLHGLRELSAVGINVTFPLKEAICALATRQSAAVRVIGAANWLSLDAEAVSADNTDAPGTVVALREFARVEMRGASVWIYGAGGAARAAAYGLLDAGARRVNFVARRPRRALEAVEHLQREFPSAEVALTAYSAVEPSSVRDAEIVINATPVGMPRQSSFVSAPEPVWPAEGFTDSQCCFDFVYHPSGTGFVDAARRSGAHAIGGLALLVAQAKVGFEMWTGRSFSLREMYDAASDVLARGAV